MKNTKNVLLQQFPSIKFSLTQLHLEKDAKMAEQTKIKTRNSRSSSTFNHNNHQSSTTTLATIQPMKVILTQSASRESQHIRILIPTFFGEGLESSLFIFFG